MLRLSVRARPCLQPVASPCPVFGLLVDRSFLPFPRCRLIAFCPYAPPSNGSVFCHTPTCVVFPSPCACVAIVLFPPTVAATGAATRPPSLSHAACRYLLLPCG